MRTRTAVLAAAIGLLPACLPLPQAVAETAAQDDGFYRGKTITIVIPIGPGGAYDAYARLVSRHLGGVIASNYLYNVAPQDGTTLAIITSSFANEQVSGNPQIKYDAQKFLAVGRLLSTTSVLFFWHASPIKTLQDMLKRPATIAISSVNEVPAYRLRAMNKFIGTSLKMIPGYPSARDYVLASERGETDGGTSTFIGLSQLFSAYIKEKKLNILVQFSSERDRDMPDVPTVVELTKDAEAKQIFHQLVSNDEIGRALFTTPNVPPDRLKMLRSAFLAMIADADFQAEATRLRLPLEPKSGEEMQKLIAEMFAIPPETLAKIRELSK
jgi:tripartite-type tricarboxylate transporter receptor subunit TctC